MLRPLSAVAVALATISGTGSSTAHADPLETASRLYDNREYEAASGELLAVLDRDSQADEPTKLRAELMFARTLVALKYPAVALASFHKITEATQSNPLRNAALKWIVVALEGAHGTADVLHSYRGDRDLDERMDAETRDALHFHLGRDAAANRDFDDADRELSAVPMSSKWGTRSRFELSRIRFRVKDVEGAIKAAELAARDPELAMLAAREISTWVRRLNDPAAEVSAMRRIAGGESLAAAFAAFELSRLSVEDTAAVTGLAKLPGGTFADVITLATCPLIATDDVFAAALPVVRATRDGIRELAQYEDNAEMYDAVRKKRATLPAIIKLALDEPATREVAEYRDELAREIDQLERTDSGWKQGPVASQILQELTVQLSIVEADLGRRFHDRLVGLAGELDQIEKVLGAPVKLSAGATVTPGTGFVVADAACGTAKAQGQLPVPQNHGCAGCASAGSAGWLVALALVLVRRRRAR